RRDLHRRRHRVRIRCAIPAHQAPARLSRTCLRRRRQSESAAMMRFDTATAAIASARRASAADRHAAMRFDVELRALNQLAAIADEWRRLSGRAVEPNAFYEPAFALAAAPLLGANVQVGLVWSQTPRQLVGFFPVRLD